MKASSDGRKLEIIFDNADEMAILADALYSAEGFDDVMGIVGDMINVTKAYGDKEGSDGRRGKRIAKLNRKDK
jgi:hypothetical protein